jgi:hypothetical protein
MGSPDAGKLHVRWERGLDPGDRVVLPALIRCGAVPTQNIHNIALIAVFCRTPSEATDEQRFPSPLRRPLEASGCVHCREQPVWLAEIVGIKRLPRLIATPCLRAGGMVYSASYAVKRNATHYEIAGYVA